MPMRIFIVDHEDRAKRFPWSRFARLYERDGFEPLLEFRDEWVRFAEMVIETESRRPVRILRALYLKIKVGSDGRPDPKELDDRFHLSVGTIEPAWADESGVLIGRPLWAKKKLKDRHAWEPSPFLERTLRRMALSR